MTQEYIKLIIELGEFLGLEETQNNMSVNRFVNLQIMHIYLID